VAFATLTPVLVEGDDMRAALDRAVIPASRVERHGRLWRMGKCRWEGASLVGRLGFQRRDFAEVWDETAQDFTEQEIQAGYASPFAIDPANRRVAFQPRLNLIKVMSFTGALQALMNVASPAKERWRVHQELHDAAFYDWAKRQDRVATLRLKVERPNPGYHGRDKVERIIEGTRARMVELVLTADPESGLNVDDDLVRQAVEHAEASYGSYRAAGELGGEPQRWDSKTESFADVREKIPADPSTGEIPARGLRELLGDTGPDDQGPPADDA
jgi:hypothetical protein